MVSSINAHLSKADELYKSKDYAGAAKELDAAAGQVTGEHAEELEQATGAKRYQMFTRGLVTIVLKKDAAKLREQYAAIYPEARDWVSHYVGLNSDDEEVRKKAEETFNTWLESRNATFRQGYDMNITVPLVKNYVAGKQLINCVEKIQQLAPLVDARMDDSLVAVVCDLKSKTQLVVSVQKNQHAVIDAIAHGKLGAIGSNELASMSGQERMALEHNDNWEEELKPFYDR